MSDLLSPADLDEIARRAETGDDSFGAIDRTALLSHIAQLEARLPKCDGGCDYNSGPEETCSLHGRPVAEVWQIVTDMAAERDAAKAQLAGDGERIARAIEVHLTTLGPPLAAGMAGMITGLNVAARIARTEAGA